MQDSGWLHCIVVTPERPRSATLAAPGRRPPLTCVVVWNVAIPASLGPSHPIQLHTLPYCPIPYTTLLYCTCRTFCDTSTQAWLQSGELSKSIWARSALGNLCQNRPWSSQVKGILKHTSYLSRTPRTLPCGEI